ncbi:MAG: hypothetical protein A2201_04195 [Alicyclobacillus sp. RIFOXYA1_FULL_53_8]|nr:MAG: hypothetical protein A2201_04195 [Alicyclobacillus sp. RIFOXYA1_FULL_53_8]
MQEHEFQQLYETHYSSVVRFVTGALRSQSDCDDLVQEVFIRVFQQYDRFRAEASLRTWILAIAKNLISDYWRKQLRRDGILPKTHNVARDVLVQPVAAIQGTSDPADEVAQADQLRRIRDSIDLLPEPMRLVLLCRVYQGLNVAETASVLGWSVGKVRVTYTRALRKFRGKWQQESREATWAGIDIG